MAVLPLLFYGVYLNWKYQKIGILFMKGSAVALGGVMVGILVLSIQIGYVSGTLAEGIDYILSTFGRRTYSEGYVDQAISFIHTLGMYWSSKIIDLNHLFHGVSVSINHLITIFLGCSCYLSIQSDSSKYKLNMALIITLWTSIIAPLAWLIIFKNHSFFHTHMNHIVWSMPFTILGTVLVGVASQLAFEKIRKRLSIRFSFKDKQLEA